MEGNRAKEGGKDFLTKYGKFSETAYKDLVQKNLRKSSFSQRKEQLYTPEITYNHERVVQQTQKSVLSTFQSIDLKLENIVEEMRNLDEIKEESGVKLKRSNLFKIKKRRTESLPDFKNILEFADKNWMNKVKTQGKKPKGAFRKGKKLIIFN